MSNIAEFRNHLRSLEPALKAWGGHVVNYVQNCLASNEDVSLQIISSRVKDMGSALGKIVRKEYTDPVNQMTDLVGVRFVVLISPQLALVSEAIENGADWTYTLDRDERAATENAPEHFMYLSRHYVVRARAELALDGVSIPEGLPCEIQVRTIMQHAYAEVVHDDIYKARGAVPPQARRFAASSMALMETADHLFCETMRLLNEENSTRQQLLKELAVLYRSEIGDLREGFDEKLNLMVLRECDDFIQSGLIDQIKQLIRDNGFIVGKIKDRLAYDPFWLQPTVLFAYWLVEHEPEHAYDDWPFAFAHDAMASVYADLGKSIRH